MIALGCLTELSRPLDERIYTKEAILRDEEDEINAAQTRYRRFITWYQERYFLVIKGELINPSYLFRRRLVDFASTIVLYAREQENDFLKAPVGRKTVSEPAITRNILAHFNDAWAELSDIFLEVKKNPSSRLYYDGPEIRIIARPSDWRQQFAALLYSEQDEWSLAPLGMSALQRLRAARSGGRSGETSSSGEGDMDVDGDDEDEDDEESDDSKNESQVQEGEQSDDVIEINSSDDDSSSSGEDETPAVPTTALGSTTTQRPFKRTRASSASTVNKSPSSSHPAKRQR